MTDEDLKDEITAMISADLKQMLGDYDIDPRHVGADCDFGDSCAALADAVIEKSQAPLAADNARLREAIWETAAKDPCNDKAARGLIEVHTRNALSTPAPYARYPYTHHGPAIHGDKVTDYLISEAQMREDQRIRNEALEEAAAICDDLHPATQDIQSTMICEALLCAAAAIRKLKETTE